ncbi:MAG: hypothetical protein R3C49_26255 [Planctomycetaceae bacterium]
MISVNQVYRAYPDSDLLGISVDESTTLDDIEDVSATLGDTLFLFLCRELCEEELTVEEAARRCDSAIEQISAVRDSLREAVMESP